MAEGESQVVDRQDTSSAKATGMPYVEPEESRANMRKHLATIETVHNTPNEGSTLRQKLKTLVDEFTNNVRERGLRMALFCARCRVDSSMLYDSIAAYHDQGQSELEYTCKRDFTGVKVVVYTAIYGGYDLIKEPNFVSPNIDYVIFTDTEVPEGSVWSKGDTSHIEGFDKLNGSLKARYIKTHPHEVLPQYDYSLWVDGTTRIIGDVLPLIDRMGESTIAIFEHPHRDCIYTEGNAILYYNIVMADKVRRQLKAYRKAGMPKHYGLHETTVVLRKHNDAMCRELMDAWWYELEHHSMRDQLSLQYVLWRRGLKHDYVYSLGPNRFFNPRFCFEDHHRERIFR